jgi:hypothetical protein
MRKSQSQSIVVAAAMLCAREVERLVQRRTEGFPLMRRVRRQMGGAGKRRHHQKIAITATRRRTWTTEMMKTTIGREARAVETIVSAQMISAGHTLDADAKAATTKTTRIDRRHHLAHFTENSRREQDEHESKKEKKFIFLARPFFECWCGASVFDYCSCLGLSKRSLGCIIISST